MFVPAGFLFLLRLWPRTVVPVLPCCDFNGESVSVCGREGGPRGVLCEYGRCVVERPLVSAEGWMANLRLHLEVLMRTIACVCTINSFGV
jgi:hypothetical protein